MVELYDNRNIFKNNVIGFDVMVNAQWVAFYNGSKRQKQRSLVNGLTWSLAGNIAKHRDGIEGEEDLKAEFTRQLVAVQNYCSNPKLLKNKGMEFVKYQRKYSVKNLIDIPWLKTI